MKRIVLLVVTAFTAAALVGNAGAAGTTSACPTGTLTGTFPGGLTITAGVSCTLVNATVAGGLNANGVTSLTLDNVKITKGADLTNIASLRISRSMVTGQANCAGSTVVSYTNNKISKCGPAGSDDNKVSGPNTCAPPEDDDPDGY